MNTQAFLLHALSPLHAGTGVAADVIDLPTARMRATGIPIVPGSSIKGVLRDRRREDPAKNEKLLAVFGPDLDNAGSHAGALTVGDARLLLLPVRSFRGTFAWVTSPMLMVLALRDLGVADQIPRFDGRGAAVPSDSICVMNGKLYLEDLDLDVQHGADLGNWTTWLAPLVSPNNDIFSTRFAVIDDDTMTFLWETATQIDTRVRLDEETRTAASGALWTEESLPPETILIGLIAADQSRRTEVRMSREEVLDFALPKAEVVQFGGKATVGRGRCRILPVGSVAGDEG